MSLFSKSIPNCAKSAFCSFPMFICTRWIYTTLQLSKRKTFFWVIVCRVYFFSKNYFLRRTVE